MTKLKVHSLKSDDVLTNPLSPDALSTSEHLLATFFYRKERHPHPYNDLEPAKERVEPWKDHPVDFSKIPRILDCKMDDQNCVECRESIRLLVVKSETLAGPEFGE